MEPRRCPSKRSVSRRAHRFSGQIVGGKGVVIFTHVEVDGQVVYDTPGQAHRTDLWTCTIEELTGVVAQVALTPRG